MNELLGVGVGAGNFLTFSTGFFWTANTIFLFLLITAWRSIRFRRKSADVFREKIARYGGMESAPPVSVLVPAHNEESVILQSVSAFLELRYPSYEVIVINDGSEDGTLDKLKAHFELEPAPLERKTHVSSSSVRGAFRSKKDARLLVLDKPNSGKADSLNLAIDFSRHGIFCAVDADSIPERDALAKAIIPFIDAPETTIAAGGSIRVFNGLRLRNNRIEGENLPSTWLGTFQVVEYVRSFFCARVGWNFLNATILISGAFGLFRKRTVVEAGGYKIDSISEDLELVVRLHRHCREKEIPYSIAFIPDPVCFTLVPESFKALYEQRRRWQRGLVETLLGNLGMVFNPRYGALGLFTMPYHLLVEVIGPVIESATWVCLALALAFGHIDFGNFLIFLLASLGYGTALTAASIWLERQYFSEFSPRRGFLVLCAFSVLENFGYRQLLSIWRTVSLFAGIETARSWRKAPRESFGA